MAAVITNARWRLLMRRLEQVRCRLYLDRELTMLERWRAMAELTRIRREIDRMDRVDSEPRG